MKRLNILCEAAKITQARERAKTLMGEEVLRTPLSQKGVAPVTHWFCSLNVTEEGYQKIMDLKQYTVIEEGSPKEFLDKWKLQIIRESKAS